MDTAAGLTHGDPESVGMDADRIDKVRALIREQVSSGRSPSIAAVVARKGTIVLEEAHGVQRPGGLPLEIDHMFPVASITKPFTAAVVMALVEQGRIGLMQRIVDYLPDFDDGTLDDVLVHHLLTHTTGWDTPQFGNAEMAQVYNEARSAVDMSARPADRDVVDWLGIETLKHVPRSRPAGELMVYHSASYDLLGEIVRRVCGSTLHDAMSRYVSDPLGLADSAVIVDEPYRDRVVERDPALPFGSAETSEFGIGFQGDLWWLMDSGGGGLHISARDMLTFCQMILAGGTYNGQRVLSRAAVRAMTTNQIPGTGAAFGPLLLPEASWAYGFTIRGAGTLNYFGGSFATPGTATHPGAGGMDVWIDFDNELVAVYFECVTDISTLGQPVSSRGNRFADMVLASVVG
ncbi:MAG: serine hydrolase domain-containing protein [Acidimicrobiales bacterium]